MDNTVAEQGWHLEDVFIGARKPNWSPDHWAESDLYEQGSSVMMRAMGGLPAY